MKGLNFSLRVFCQSGINSILKLLPGLFSNEFFCSLFNLSFHVLLLSRASGANTRGKLAVPNELRCLTHTICKQLLETGAIIWRTSLAGQQEWLPFSFGESPMTYFNVINVEKSPLFCFWKTFSTQVWENFYILFKLSAF